MKVVIISIVSVCIIALLVLFLAEKRDSNKSIDNVPVNVTHKSVSSDAVVAEQAELNTQQSEVSPISSQPALNSVTQPTQSSSNLRTKRDTPSGEAATTPPADLTGEQPIGLPDEQPVAASDKISADEMAADFVSENNSILRMEKLRRWNTEKKGGIDKVATVALEDSDPMIVMEAIGVLGELKSDASTTELLKVLDEGRERPDGYGQAICLAAITALGTAQNASPATPLLVASLTEHIDLSYDKAIVESLGNIGDYEAIVPIESYIAYLKTIKPNKPFFLHPWQEAMDIATEALNKLRASNP